MRGVPECSGRKVSDDLSPGLSFNKKEAQETIKMSEIID